MFTATKGVVLPTMVTGSWPRPTWYEEQLRGRTLSNALMDVRFREQYSDALSTVIQDQERAGLDILVNGDYHHDDTLAGYHWIAYALERMKGFEGDFGEQWAEWHLTPGSLMYELAQTWRWPRAEAKIEREEGNSLDFAKIWRISQARTSKPVMFGTVSAQAVAAGVTVADTSPYSDDRRALVWDMAEVINQELRELAAAGCKVIQIEEPYVHSTAYLHPDDTDEIDFLVDAFNREVEGLEDVELWVHTCWGNPNQQRAFPEASYANSIATYLERMNFDVWTVEAKSDDGEILSHLAPFRKTLADNSKKIALGAISQRTMQVETPEEVADFTRRALKVIPAENLALTTDCGYSRPGVGRLVALYKSAAMTQGANIIRRELGVDENYVPLADPALQLEVR